MRLNPLGSPKLDPLWVPNLVSQIVNVGRALFLPRLGLPGVQPGANVGQCISEKVVQRTGSVWVRHHVNIVKVREKQLNGEHAFLHRQGIVDCQAEEQWHQGIPLFSAFVVVNVEVLHAIGVCPLMSRGLSAIAPDERE